jgi:hypothetical protein
VALNGGGYVPHPVAGNGLLDPLLQGFGGDPDQAGGLLVDLSHHHGQARIGPEALVDQAAVQ